MSTTPCQKFLQNILGTWEGAGAGEYPTMPNFAFGAKSEYKRVSEKTKAHFIHTSVESWKPNKKGEIGMHYENGFMKCSGTNELEWGLAHNFAGTEATVGTVNDDGTSAKFKSTGFGNVSYLTGTKRELTVDAASGKLQDEFWMSTHDTPMTHHLSVKYNRAAKL